MVTIRCTQKLLRRIPPQRTPESATAPTTLLGDWYANVLFARPQQLVLCISERTFLSVVVAASPAVSLASRLAHSLGPVLASLGVEPQRVVHEQREMESFAFGRTSNRRVLGTLNELLFQLSWYLHDHPDMPLATASLRLARTPCSALPGAFPDRVTSSLFATRSAPC